MRLTRATLFLILLFHHAAVLAEVTFRKVTKEPGDIKELSRSQVKGKTTCALLCWKKTACTHYALEGLDGAFRCIFKGYNPMSSDNQEQDALANTWAVVSDKPRNCRDIWVKRGVEKRQSATNHPYLIYPNGKKLTVLCAMTIRGWVVAQFNKYDRSSGKWNSSWETYEEGFTSQESFVDFSYSWAGLSALHELTKETPHTLRIYGHPRDKIRAFGVNDTRNTIDGYEEYGLFQVGGPSTNYRAHVGEWNRQGRLDLLNCATNEKMAMNGSMFTTWDRDNDNFVDGNRASTEGGGWWYNEDAAFTPTREHPIYFVDCNKTDGYRQYFNLTTMVLMPRG